jgi:hypothetical protein
MEAKEVDLFASVLCNGKTERYLEFGAGGSTLMAAYCNVRDIVSLDNAAMWQKTVGEHEIWSKSTSHVQQLHVGLGELGAYSRPKDNESYGDFIHYSHGALRYTQGAFDVVLVDGRFRVACALIAIQRMDSQSALFVHDYDQGRGYDVLAEVLEIEKRVGQLVQFRLPGVIDILAIERLMRSFSHEVD